MTPVILEVILGILLLVYLVARWCEIRWQQCRGCGYGNCTPPRSFRMLPMLKTRPKAAFEQVRVDKTAC